MGWFLYDNGLRLERVKHSTTFQGISLFALFHTGDVSLVNRLFCIHLFRICEELFKQN